MGCAFTVNFMSLLSPLHLHIYDYNSSLPEWLWWLMTLVYCICALVCRLFVHCEPSVLHNGKGSVAKNAGPLGYSKLVEDAQELRIKELWEVGLVARAHSVERWELINDAKHDSFHDIAT